MVSRLEVYLVSLDPTVGHGIRKTRPCLLVSPDELTHHIDTVIIAPMTTESRAYPTRVPARSIVSSVLAACPAPITLHLAPGQASVSSGSNARPHMA